LAGVGVVAVEGVVPSSAAVVAVAAAAHDFGEILVIQTTQGLLRQRELP
jgi:hypothetical protein